MLTVRCSELESVRANPNLYVQTLINDQKTGGGTFGMFACWQSIARQMHVDKLAIGESINSLNNKFGRFASNKANTSRQEKLIEALIKYDKEFNKKGFEFDYGNKRIKWDIHKEVRLTGNTPWIVKKKDQYYSFFFIENDFDWTNQLRFPLLQNYIANEIVECDSSVMNIGVYNLANAGFNFRVYEEDQIDDAIAETKTLFHNVYQQYSKHR